MRLKALVNRIFIEARSIVGRLGIRTIWKGGDVGAGKYYVRHLMKDAGLICKKKRGLYKYKHKQASVESIEIPGRLNPQFEVAATNKN